MKLSEQLEAKDYLTSYLEFSSPLKENVHYGYQKNSYQQQEKSIQEL